MQVSKAFTNIKHIFATELQLQYLFITWNLIINLKIVDNEMFLEKQQQQFAMSKKNKLIERFLLIPTDLSWEELVTILSFYGYEEIKKGKSGGSRRKFADEEKNIINLHKPHPSNVVKEYAIKQVIEQLKEKGKIKDE